MMGCRWGLLVVLLALSLLSVPALAPIPQVISVQGRLTNSSGGLQCGAWNMTFEIYDASSGGNRQFLEYRDNVTDQVANDCRGAYVTIPSSPSCEGIFNARLGETTGCPVNATTFNTADAYLQLSINGSLLTPRHRLTSAGYTFRTNVSEIVLGSATAGTVLNNLNPATDNSYTLGTAALRWLAGFFSKNITIGSTSFINSTHAGIGTTSPGLYNLNVMGDVNASWVNATTGVKGTNVCIGNDCRTAWPTAAVESPWTNSSLTTFVRGGYPINVNISGNLTVVGCAFATYAGLTGSAYNGALTSGGYTGYVAANTLCSASFAGSHLCTTDEILESIRCGLKSTFTNDTQGWVAEGPPGYTADANDCVGWTSSSSSALGAFWIFNDARGGDGWLINCASTKKLACCR